MTNKDGAVGSCGQCGHDNGPHVLLSFYSDPKLGGVRLCPIMNCECYGTWTVALFSTYETLDLPPRDVIDAARRELQAEYEKVPKPRPSSAKGMVD